MPSRDRLEILKRGTRARCPNCGMGPVLRNTFVRYERCPHCGMVFAPEDGFFLAATAVNYGLVCGAYLFPLLLVWVLGLLPDWPALVLCILGVVALPALLYRYTQCLWLGIYYAVVPTQLDEGGTRPE